MTKWSMEEMISLFTLSESYQATYFIDYIHMQSLETSHLISQSN